MRVAVIPPEINYTYGNRGDRAVAALDRRIGSRHRLLQSPSLTSLPLTSQAPRSQCFRGGGQLEAAIANDAGHDRERLTRESGRAIRTIDRASFRLSRGTRRRTETTSMSPIPSLNVVSVGAIPR